SLNRSKTDSKKFRCTCCGYENDADYVGAINIRNRATDTELLAVCRSVKNHKTLQSGIKKLLESRNIDWINKNLTTPILQEPKKAISLS
ncbi:MAG: zinc ribbon domain-containing protein, partial [Erysipelotrichaceae bacterium]